MEEKIYSVEFKEEFRVCPECGYTDGFHTVLRRDADRIKWLFICPACHKMFDIGATVNLF
ncbi:MAG: hypothetical protein MI862_01755 [Desulfobacterales bacterium]|nr:hypothetical protein [Desulfobacterales bacterium]